MPGQDFQRDRFQRPLVIPPGGGSPVPYVRATTLAGAIDDTYNLMQWQKRQVAAGLSGRPDLILAASAHRDDKSEMDSIAEKAMEAAGASAAATTGTALHLLTEKIDGGEKLPFVPEAHRADLDAYRAATAGFTVRAIEKRVVNDDLQAAGTTDRIYEVDGKSIIGDVKTGSRIDYGIGKIAMQLAIYANAVGYDPETGTREPLGVETDWGLIVHLPAGQGRCEVLWVDLTWGAYGTELATAVRSFRKKRFNEITRKAA